MKVLITVKTYPTLSRKYGETVCTAGVQPDGSWVRIYPVPFRRLDQVEQYKKFDWLDCELIKSKDFRRESHHPKDVKQLKPVGHLGTDHNWRERRKLLLQPSMVEKNLKTLIRDAKANKKSLAVFKPTKIIDFLWEEESPEWDASKLEEMRNQTKQGELFSDETWRQTFKMIPKLPFSFSYKFLDEESKESTMQILDWEIGALYWNCLQSSSNDKQAALEKVRQKYFGDFMKTDLHFFLGTTQQFHAVAPNPWVIVGVFPIPHEHQQEFGSLLEH